MTGYIKDGWVCVSDERGEFRLELASNRARNAFGHELDETWEEISKNNEIHVSEVGNPYIL